MPGDMEELKQLIYSIQTVYNLYWDGDVAGKTMGMPYALRCRETIKVPISEIVSREYNTVMYDVIPVTALVIENDFPNPTLPRLKFIISCKSVYFSVYPVQNIVKYYLFHCFVDKLMPSSRV